MLVCAAPIFVGREKSVIPVSLAWGVVLAVLQEGEPVWFTALHRNRAMARSQLEGSVEDKAVMRCLIAQHPDRKILDLFTAALTNFFVVGARDATSGGLVALARRGSFVNHGGGGSANVASRTVGAARPRRCPLPTSSAGARTGARSEWVALRAIAAGEELLMDYGAETASAMGIGRSPPTPRRAPSHDEAVAAAVAIANENLGRIVAGSNSTGGRRSGYRRMPGDIA